MEGREELGACELRTGEKKCGVGGLELRVLCVLDSHVPQSRVVIVGHASRDRTAPTP